MTAIARPLPNAPDAPPQGGGRWRSVPPVSWALALGALTLVLTYLPNLMDLARGKWTEPNYTHAWLVPFVSGFVLWQRRALFQRAAWGSAAGWPWGIVALLACAAVRLASYARNEPWFEDATLVPALLAVVLAIGGRSMVRWAWPGVVFLVFLLPLPGRLDASLARPLRALAATSGAAVLETAGVPVLREGNVLIVGGERLSVEQACSGMAMLMTLVAVVTAVVMVVEQPWWQRVILMASAVPIALLSNVVRVAGTGLAYWLFPGTELAKWSHDGFGLLMMPLGFGLVVLEMKAISWLIVPESPEGPDGRRPASLVFGTIGGAPRPGPS